MPSALSLALFAALAAQPSQLDGSGESYWGPVPPESESELLLVERHQRAAWEWPLYGTYRVLRFPFQVLGAGAKRMVIFLDESGTFYHAKRLLGDISLPYGLRVGGVFDVVTGFGLGANVYHDEVGRPGSQIQLKGLASFEGHRRASVGYELEWAERRSLVLGLGYRLRPNARFYGIGPGSVEEDRSHFTQENAWGGVEFRWGLRRAEKLELSLGALQSSVSTRGPRDDGLSSIEDDDAFAAMLPVGYGERSYGVELSLGLEHDTTRQEARPLGTGLRRVRAGYFFAQEEEEPSFWTFRLEAQQFFRLWWDRAFAVRGVTTWMESDEGDPHFVRLMSNEDPDQMRAYDDFRFRDRGFIGLNVEYRYPIWAYSEPKGTGLDAYLFTDTAQVFGRTAEISTRNLRPSYGGGIRFLGRRGFGARAEIGVGEEGTAFRLSMDQVFQYPRNALYDGREPIPLR